MDQTAVVFELTDIVITPVSVNDEVLHMVTAAHLAQTEYTRPCEHSQAYRRAVEVGHANRNDVKMCSCPSSATNAASSASGRVPDSAFHLELTGHEDTTPRMAPRTC